MVYFSDEIHYRQYELLQGDTHLICWLPHLDLKLGSKVKIDSDPFWWKVIGKSDTIKVEHITDRIVLD